MKIFLGTWFLGSCENLDSAAYCLKIADSARILLIFREPKRISTFKATHTYTSWHYDHTCPQCSPCKNGFFIKFRSFRSYLDPQNEAKTKTLHEKQNAYILKDIKCLWVSEHLKMSNIQRYKIFKDIKYSNDFKYSKDIKYLKYTKYFANSVQDLHLIIPRHSLISLIVLMMLVSKYYRDIGEVEWIFSLVG